ncbi:DUF3160 domain-containing protein [candidate division KSB1 bacterium]|nr:DUF3160 domain-containing protein [candidate division KSB1 bacterium]RQW00709.1 MAG: DUF3160 domain-containing protein [candidate division KSB1 bacterium]
MRKVTLFFVFLPAVLLSQSNFSAAAYEQFLKENANKTAQQIITQYEPDAPYYNDRTDALLINDYAYLDSIEIKYGLTKDESAKLEKNHFVVSERLSFDCFGRAMHDIYQKDLPVLVTSDAILYALHFSYDRILFDIERTLLEKKLARVLDALYENLPALATTYADYSELSVSIEDVDIYITLAKSLLDDRLLPPHIAEKDVVDDLWNAIASEQMTFMPLFSERFRRLDFSQFTVRGHYTNEFWDINGKRTLGNYFKAMMWLGRMDFYLTPPPVGPDERPWSRDEIRRMMVGALLLNELLDLAGVRAELNEIDDIITFMVGESDNLTPTELSEVVANLGITPLAVFDESIYDLLQAELVSNVIYGQRIMSAFFIVDPYSNKPDELPVSFRLSGQRFIIDSYILANVVYDRIIFNNIKVWRPMPDPLDAMFVLGNDNALPLLKDQIEEYKYASQLEALRYLVDAYDQDFWDNSLYNVWLQGIRSLNPSEMATNVPYFMKTVAWQQQKLNTQLSSWTQLRHDNLLYAKQSYTGGTSCSYPHSFIEPYPKLFQSIATFAEKAQDQLLPLLGDNFWETYLLKQYFPKLKDVMLKLKALAEKESAGELFTEEEREWLKRMLFIDGMSGAPPFSGWYADLFYHLEQTPDGQYEGHDYLVADVHTQPTDRGGFVVGRVLHVGVGEVNMGIFLASSPSMNYQNMAYVGPVMSYYEKITENFKRHTDEEWAELVQEKKLPERPVWVNIYLTDEKGNARAAGPELPGVQFVATNVDNVITPLQIALRPNYPNPFNPSTMLTYILSSNARAKILIYNSLGQEIAVLVDRQHEPGEYTVEWNGQDFPSGLYFAKMYAGELQKTVKMMLIK